MCFSELDASCSPVCLNRKHLRWTISGPDSANSSLATCMFWNVESEARIEPPIQTEYFRAGAMSLIFIVGGASWIIFSRRVLMPGYIVFPPDRMMFPYRSLRMSTSHFMIEL